MGGNRTATASATTPPMIASRMRFGALVPPIISSSIAETAASLTTRSEPLNSTATDIASDDQQGELPRPGADQVHEQRGEREADHDAGREAERALAVLAVRGADRDHGRDAGEHRLGVGQQPDAQVPRRRARRARSGRSRASGRRVGGVRGEEQSYVVPAVCFGSLQCFLKRRIFDTHLHIVDPRFPLVPNQGYLPPPFTVDDYRARCRRAPAAPSCPAPSRPTTRRT